MITVDEFLRYAEEKHKGQFRFDGVTPYFNHIEDVWDNVCDKGGDRKRQLVAIGHDLIEDCDVTTTDLLEYGLDIDVVEAIDILSKKEDQYYSEYLDLVKKNELARFVKICDMLANLNDSPTKKQVKKYSSGLLYLIEL